MKKAILTIDTEGPRGTDPVLYQIWGKVGDDSFYGVPEIIKICDRYNVKGLFFVDIPEIWDYGYEKIKEVILYIRKHGHDVGMHIHPHHMPNEKRQFLFDYTKEEQRKIIAQCTKKYVEITGEYPVSFRAGKYGANKDTLDLIEEMGYAYDFSEFYSQKWCGINPPVAYVLPQKYKNLVEFPVTVFKSFSLGKIYHRYDKLEATYNTSELKYVLDCYAKTSNEEVITIFLHSFSLLNFLDTPDAPTVNQEHLRRFENILKYIAESPDWQFISEKELENVTVPETDSEDNIVCTKGIFRNWFYLFFRAFEIRKTNRKAKLLISTGYVILLLIAIAVILLLGKC